MDMRTPMSIIGTGTGDSYVNPPNWSQSDRMSFAFNHAYPGDKRPRGAPVSTSWH